MLTLIYTHTQSLARVLQLYIVFDFVWILLQPQCVPKSNLVLVHHVTTAILILHPLFYPEHGVFTCLDGLVEINTIILTYRRNYPSTKGSWGEKCLTWAHWTTFVGFRLIAYPYFTHVFYEGMRKVVSLRVSACLCSRN